MIQVGDGGSGPYKSVLVGDPNLKTHTLYRPRDLTVFGANLKLPVVAYGNGACRNASYEVRNFLTEVASHGFLVVAIGPVIPTIAGGAYVSGPTKSAQLLDAVDWATCRERAPGQRTLRKGGHFEGGGDGPFLRRAAGHRGVHGSSRYDHSDVEQRHHWGASRATGGSASGSNTRAGRGGPGGMPGMPAVTKDQLAKLHAPIAYIIGGKSDIAHDNAADDFAKIESVPVVMANREAAALDPRALSSDEGLQVHPGGEALARAGEHAHLQVVVGVEHVEGRGDPMCQRRVHRVARVGTVEGHEQDLPAALL